MLPRYLKKKKITLFNEGKTLYSYLLFIALLKVV